MRIHGGVVSFALLLPLAAQREVGFLPEHAVRWSDAGPAGGARARAAVIVTADRYGNAAFDAPSAKPSGEALRQALLEHAGFSRASIVELAGDQVHEAAVQAAIERAAASIGDGKTMQQGTLLVLWVGHGFTQGGEQQLFGYFTQQVANGFAPVVTQRQLAAWLDAAYTRARARGVELATALVVDACRPNVGAPPKDAVAVRAKAWQVFSATEGKFALAASPDAPFVFSQAFAEAVDMRARQSGAADLGDVFRQAKELTERRTAGAQVPEIVPPADPALAKSSPAVVVPRRIAFSVRLVDALTGGRVERAVVRLNDMRHETTEGSLALSAAPGAHQLEVHAEGYLNRAEPLALGDERADGEVTVPLLPHVTVLRARVSPPRVVELKVAAESARKDYHVLSAVTDAKGEAELRLPALGASFKLQVLRAGRELQQQDVDATPSGWLRDRSGQHAGIPLLEVPVALAKAALDVIGDDLGAGVADAAAPKAKPALRGLDATEFQLALQNIGREQWDLARTNLQNIEATSPELGRWLAYVEAKWARAALEKALAEGRRSGEWSAADPVLEWWNKASGKPSVDNKDELSRLVGELERERVPLAVRKGFESGNLAYSAGELEKALGAYQAVRGQANAHYGALLDEQITDIQARLYGRHVAAGNQHEADGDKVKAKRSYEEARKYSERAKRYLDRLASSMGETTLDRPASSMGETTLDDLDLTQTRVLLRTNYGQMVVRFFPEKAPETVKNFVKLAKEHFYDGTKFHRVMKGFMIQGGCPNTKDGAKGTPGTGDPGYTIKAEFNDIRHVRGVLSMARAADPNSGGSQFFIMHGPAPHLDGNYTAFGELDSGLDTLDQIAHVDVKMSSSRELSVPIEPVHLYAAIVLPVFRAKPEVATSTAPAGSGAARIETGIGLAMIHIEAQDFAMGSPESEAGRDRDEVRHRVKITKPFWIGETEVTQKQWREVMGTAPWKGQPYTIEGDAVAASFVSWTDAMEFCRKLTERERAAGRLPEGYRYILPTEAEWELACRAGSGTAYCFGDDAGRLREYAVYEGARSGEYAHVVKQRKASAWGLYDMHGNVWEWCLDEADSAGGVVTSTYRDGVVDPCNTGGPRRVSRGGCSFNPAQNCRSAARGARVPDDANSFLGFRPVLAARSGAK